MQKGLDYGKELKFLHDFFFIDNWGPRAYGEKFMPIVEVTLNTMVNDLFDLGIPVEELDVPDTVLVPGNAIPPKPSELHGEDILDKYLTKDFVGLYTILILDIHKYSPIMYAPIASLMMFYHTSGSREVYKKLIWALAELTILPLTDKVRNELVSDLHTLFHSWDDDDVNTLLEILGGQNDNLGKDRYT